MEPIPPPPARRVPLLGWVVLAILIAVGVALAMPLRYSFGMNDREETARARLKLLVNAESQWRQNDCDRNGVADYWTRDVAGFH